MMNQMFQATKIKVKSLLKRSVFLRRMVYSIRRSQRLKYGYFICCNLVRRNCFTSGRLMRLKEYAKKSKNHVYLIAPSCKVETIKPRLFDSAKDELIAPQDFYISPEVYIAKLSNVTVQGATNFVFDKDTIIVHDLYDFDSEYTREELQWRVAIYEQGRKVKYLQPQATYMLKVAASFLDACSFNYAHWITEVLPRVVVFCKDSRFTDIPLLIDANLHPNLMASLKIVAGESRKIILVQELNSVHVESLYLVSAVGYVPYEPRIHNSKVHPHGVFNPIAIKLLREKVLSSIESHSKIKSRQKIYIKRSNKARKMINEEALETVLSARGFTFIEPEKFSFERQVQYFSNAKIIFAASGAALGNLIFSSQETKLLIIVLEHPNNNYWYWQNIAAACGKEVYYLFAKIKDQSARDVHVNYTVDIDAIIDSLDKQLTIKDDELKAVRD